MKIFRCNFYQARTGCIYFVYIEANNIYSALKRARKLPEGVRPDLELESITGLRPKGFFQGALLWSPQTGITKWQYSGVDLLGQTKEERRKAKR